MFITLAVKGKQIQMYKQQDFILHINIKKIESFTRCNGDFQIFTKSKQYHFDDKYYDAKTAYEELKRKIEGSIIVSPKMEM